MITILVALAVCVAVIPWFIYSLVNGWDLKPGDDPAMHQIWKIRTLFAVIAIPLMVMFLIVLMFTD